MKQCGCGEDHTFAKGPITGTVNLMIMQMLNRQEFGDWAMALIREDQGAAEFLQQMLLAGRMAKSLNN